MKIVTEYVLQDEQNGQGVSVHQTLEAAVAAEKEYREALHIIDCSTRIITIDRLGEDK